MTTKSTTAEKTHYATRFFRDAGTGKSFELGDAVDAAPGDLANYEAAGLVSDSKPQPAKVDDAA